MNDKLTIMGVLVMGPTRIDRMAEILDWREQRVMDAVEGLVLQGRVVRTCGCCSDRGHDTYGLIHGVKGA